MGSKPNNDDETSKANQIRRRRINFSKKTKKNYNERQNADMVYIQNGAPIPKNDSPIIEKQPKPQVVNVAPLEINPVAILSTGFQPSNRAYDSQVSNRTYENPKPEPAKYQSKIEQKQEITKPEFSPQSKMTENKTKTHIIDDEDNDEEAKEPQKNTPGCEVFPQEAEYVDEIEMPIGSTDDGGANFLRVLLDEDTPPDVLKVFAMR